MSRNDLLVRVIAAVAGIVAIALAAATVRSPLETGSSGGVGSSGSGSGSGGGGPPPMPEPREPGDVPPFLEYLVYLVVVLLAIAIVWYLLAHRRDAVRLLAVGLAVALFGIGLAYLIVTVGSSPPLPVEEDPQEFVNHSDGLVDSGGDSGSADGDLLIPTGPLFVVLALVTAVVVGGLFLSRGSDGDGGPPPEVTDPEPTAATENAAAIGSAAGRAADRIDEGTTADNEVYRAWREMTGFLEVDRPETSTPGEFARAAVDVGMERDDVDELTRLFEAVRYGRVETTPEIEDRAVSVLRRIEDEYADEGQSAADGAADDEAGGWGDRR